MRTSSLLTCFVAVVVVQALPKDMTSSFVDSENPPSRTQSGNIGTQSDVYSESAPAYGSSIVPYLQKPTDAASSLNAPAYGSSSDLTSASSSTAVGSRTTALPNLTSMETSIVRSSVASESASDSSLPPVYTNKSHGKKNGNKPSSTESTCRTQASSSPVTGKHHESSTKPCDTSSPTQATKESGGKHDDPAEDELNALAAMCKDEPKDEVCKALADYQKHETNKSHWGFHDPNNSNTRSHTHTHTASPVTSIVTVHSQTQAAATSTASAVHPDCSCGGPVADLLPRRMCLAMCAEGSQKGQV